jgi:cytochrome c oxidase subunit 2
VDTPEDYKKWLKEKPTLKEELKAEAASAAGEANTKEKDSTVEVATNKVVAQVEKK